MIIDISLRIFALFVLIFPLIYVGSKKANINEEYDIKLFTNWRNLQGENFNILDFENPTNHKNKLSFERIKNLSHNTIELKNLSCITGDIFGSIYLTSCSRNQIYKLEKTGIESYSVDLFGGTVKEEIGITKDGFSSFGNPLNCPQEITVQCSFTDCDKLVFHEVGQNLIREISLGSISMGRLKTIADPSIPAFSPPIDPEDIERCHRNQTWDRTCFSLQQHQFWKTVLEHQPYQRVSINTFNRKSQIDLEATLNLGSMSASTGFTLTGVTGEAFGYAVNIADVNGDGKYDLIASSTGYSSTTGKIYVIFGSATISSVNVASISTPSQGITFTGSSSGENAGYYISVGDVNNDGNKDILMGAMDYSSSTGRAYLVYGGTSLNANIALGSMTGSQGIVFTGTANSDFLGQTLDMGDVNGDGYVDMMIGSYGYSTNTGRGYLVFGGPSLSSTIGSSLTMSSMTASQGASYTGSSSGEFASRAVAISGDINNDGKCDIVIGGN